MKYLAIAAALTLLTGCLSPKWTRLVPENKDASIKGTLVTPWGTQQIDIQTRVNPLGNNPTLPPLQ